ncbi:hypothetical protein LUZ60_015167 [Juncus effusus]|nr:hypothetical protein LUZ60_015167 [Juncus effusus]
MDTGNNNYIATFVKADFAPYGQNFVHHSPTGHFSNGKLTSDMIATNLGVKEYMPPYFGATNQDLLTGVVFASAGSGYDVTTSTLVHVILLRKQLELFQQYKEKLKTLVGEKKASEIISKALYMVSGGGNDVVQYFNNAPTRIEMNPEGYSDELKNMAIQYVYDLYTLGARSIGVIGIPPVGCVPFQRTVAGGIHRECAKNRNEVALSYNSKMKAAFQQINAQNKLPGAKLVFVDVYPRLMELITQPEKYGFKEVKRGCCETGMVEGAVLCSSKLMPCRNVSGVLILG